VGFGERQQVDETVQDWHPRIPREFQVRCDAEEGEISGSDRQGDGVSEPFGQALFLFL